MFCIPQISRHLTPLSYVNLVLFLSHIVILAVCMSSEIKYVRVNASWTLYVSQIVVRHICDTYFLTFVIHCTYVYILVGSTICDTSKLNCECITNSSPPHLWYMYFNICDTLYVYLCTGWKYYLWYKQIKLCMYHK